METTLTFSLPDCLITDEARAEFAQQITEALATGEMPKLCLLISHQTTDKDIYQAIQTISGINKYLSVQFQLVDDSDEVELSGYLKICQSWLPNSTVVM